MVSPAKNASTIPGTTIRSASARSDESALRLASGGISSTCEVRKQMVIAPPSQRMWPTTWTTRRRRSAVSTGSEPAVLAVPLRGDLRALGERHLGLPAELLADLVRAADQERLTQLVDLVAGEHHRLVAELAPELAAVRGDRDHADRHLEPQRLHPERARDLIGELALRVDLPVLDEVDASARVVFR